MDTNSECNGHYSMEETRCEKNGISINSKEKTEAATGGFPSGDYDSLMRDSIGAVNKGAKEDLRSDLNISRNGKSVEIAVGNEGEIGHVGENLRSISNISQNGKKVGLKVGNEGVTIHVGENNCLSRGGTQSSHGQYSTPATSDFEGAGTPISKVHGRPYDNRDPVLLGKSTGSLRSWKKKAREVQRDNIIGTVNIVTLGKRQAEEKGRVTIVPKNKGRTMQRPGGSPYMIRDETDEATDGSGSAAAVAQPRPPQ